jgi:hypothetical protein
MHREQTWRVVSFSTERAMGTVENVGTGEHALFQLEAWSPCDPATARTLQDSEPRRHLLFPQPGEAVEVHWKTSRSGKTVPSRVARIGPLVS